MEFEGLTSTIKIQVLVLTGWVVIGILTGIYFRLFVEKKRLNLFIWLLFMLCGPLVLFMGVIIDLLELMKKTKF